MGMCVCACNVRCLSVCFVMGVCLCVVCVCVFVL